MVPAVINETGQFASTGTAVAQQQGQQQPNNLKVAFGEFALIDPEVVPVQQIMGKYNWTQTALHHHLLNESPKIFASSVSSIVIGFPGSFSPGFFTFACPADLRFLK